MTKLPVGPGSSEVRAILAQQVDGLIAFEHDALNPQGVVIRPMTPGDRVTVRAGDHLRLAGNRVSKSLTGEMRFAVIFDYGATRLAEVSPADRRVLEGMLPIDVEVVSEGAHPKAAKPQRPTPRLVVQETLPPDPPQASPDPQTHARQRVDLAVRWLNDVVADATAVGVAVTLQVTDQNHVAVQHEASSEKGLTFETL